MNFLINCRSSLTIYKQSTAYFWINKLYFLHLFSLFFFWKSHFLPSFFCCNISTFSQWCREKYILSFLQLIISFPVHIYCIAYPVMLLLNAYKATSQFLPSLFLQILHSEFAKYKFDANDQFLLRMQACSVFVHCEVNIYTHFYTFYRYLYIRVIIYI